MLGACREPDPAANPGVSLGLAIGTLAKAGRDKLTFLRRRRDRQLRRVGRAAHRREHRQARRRDRAGRPRAARRRRGLRRRPRLRPHRARRPARTAAATRSPTPLEAAGHPVIRIALADPIDLGAEFVRWEVATAIAGHVLGHRPVRPAQRRGGQAAHARRAREAGASRRGRAAAPSRSPTATA